MNKNWIIFTNFLYVYETFCSKWNLRTGVAKECFFGGVRRAENLCCTIYFVYNWSNVKTLIRAGVLFAWERLKSHGESVPGQSVLHLQSSGLSVTTGYKTPLTGGEANVHTVSTPRSQRVSGDGDVTTDTDSLKSFRARVSPYLFSSLSSCWDKRVAPFFLRRVFQLFSPEGAAR